MPDVVEDGTTLLDNARLKAQALTAATGLPAVADDTGLEVDALGGAPGVYSARYAGENATYRDNVAKLLLALAALDDDGGVRAARFKTVALVAFPDGSEVWAEGAVEGTIAHSRRGENGFGYDPVFVPDDGEGGDGRTFARDGRRREGRPLAPGPRLPRAGAATGGARARALSHQRRPAAGVIGTVPVPVSARELQRVLDTPGAGGRDGLR